MQTHLGPINDNAYDTDMYIYADVYRVPSLGHICN